MSEANTEHDELLLEDAVRDAKALVARAKGPQMTKANNKEVTK